MPESEQCLPLTEMEFDPVILNWPVKCPEGDFALNMGIEWLQAGQSGGFGR